MTLICLPYAKYQRDKHSAVERTTLWTGAACVLLFTLLGLYFLIRAIGS